MKHTLIFAVMVFCALFTACKKKADVVPSTPSTITVISKDSAYDGTANDTQVRLFDYNSSKKLIRVQYKYGTSTSYTSHDTIYYNASGQVSKVENYDTGVTGAQTTSIYNYTSGILTSVNESGFNNDTAYVRTRTFTYTNGKLSAQNVVYTTGHGGNGSPDDFASVVFTGNNISSVDLTPSGAGFGPVTATTDLTAPNPYYGLNFDASDFINLFDQNNILKAYLTATPTTIFVNNTYTYANGMVATIVDSSNSPTITTTVITYKTI